MILIDLLLLIFLCVCIFYSYVLNKRINELQKSKNEFSRMVKEFDLAIVRAETSIKDLTRLSNETSAKIHKATEKAQFLMNDITFMNDMGSDVANRLEKAIDQSKILEKKINNYNYNINSYPAEANSNPIRDIEEVMARFSSVKNNVAKPATDESQKTFQNIFRQVK